MAFQNYKDFYSKNPGQRIALLREKVTISPGGGLCAGMMWLSAIVMMFAFAGDTSAVRQAAYGTIGTAFVVLFGIGALMGRRSVYVVYREPPDESVEQTKPEAMGEYRGIAFRVDPDGKFIALMDGREMPFSFEADMKKAIDNRGGK